MEIPTIFERIFGSGDSNEGGVSYETPFSGDVAGEFFWAPPEDRDDDYYTD